jgi:hypothetical protein
MATLGRSNPLGRPLQSFVTKAISAGALGTAEVATAGVKGEGKPRGRCTGSDSKRLWAQTYVGNVEACVPNTPSRRLALALEVG